MCIDESVLSTLCGSNVIPVTPPMKEGGESRVEGREWPRFFCFRNRRRGRGDSLMEETRRAPSCRQDVQFATIYLIGSSKSRRVNAS